MDVGKEACLYVVMEVKWVWGCRGQFDDMYLSKLLILNIYLNSRTNISTSRNPFLMLPLPSKMYVTMMFIASLFTIARNWKQPKCSLTGGWLDKICHICPLEYCMVINKWSGLCTQHGKPPGCRSKWGEQSSNSAYNRILFIQEKGKVLMHVCV